MEYADAFSNQWEHLKQEVLDSGGSDHWQLTHPFPPLRMQALKVFWRTLDSSSDAAQADHEVSRLLALMDPLAREGGDGADPVLADFFLWGGLYVALSNGELHASEVDKIVSISSQERLDKALSTGAPSMDACLGQFRECIESRQRKLKALEIHRILQGLLAVAHADQTIDKTERDAMNALANEMNISHSACDIMIQQYLNER